MSVKKQEHFDKVTILLVDDDAGVRRVVRLALSRHSYTVLEADCADSAIQIWEQHSQHISLLLTDVRMPGKTGLELARFLRKRQPQLPILLISGYSEEFNHGEKILHSMFFLQKPFSPQALLETVHKVTQSCFLPEDQECRSL